MENYKITNNEKERIQSSVLFNHFKTKTNTKMTTSKFKEDMTDISGIIYKCVKGVKYFCGLKEMTVEDLNEDEE